MTKFSLLVCAFTVFAGCVQSEAAARPKAAFLPVLTLAQNGKSTYVIAVAGDAIPAETTAALQLQDYLRQVTGVTLPVKRETQVAGATPQILVGAGTRAKSLLPKQDWKALGSDGIVIKTKGKNLILAGGRPRGSLYAVFQFLEDTVGCRFWSPSANRIPQRKNLVVGVQNLTYVSPFNYRAHYSTAIHENPVFATIRRENGDQERQSLEWGGHYTILGFVHTFTQLLPPEKYFKDHPEWFSDANNDNKPCTAASKMPAGQATQLCMSNPQVVDEMTVQALEWIKKNPAAGYISISQNDSDNYCNCPECARLAKEEGSQAGPILHFVNQVAARIGKRYPNFWVETLAYRGSENPPKTVRPAANVLVRLAPISSDFGHPLDSVWNTKTRDKVCGWAKIAPHLFVWNYVANFNSTLMPHPNWAGLGSDLRFFAAHNVVGIFEQGNDYTNDVGDFAPLRTWLLAKLMWNPALDQRKLTDEFLKGYYGPAAPYLRQYLDLIQSAFLQKKSSLSLSNRDFSFLGLAEMNRATRLFRQASAAVKADAALSLRVRREQISLDLAWIYRYRALREAASKTGAAFLGPQDSAVALDKFYATAQDLGVKFWGEHVTLASQRNILEGRLAPAVPLPGFAKNFAAEDVVDIQDRAFSLHGENIAGLENDPAASDGKAAASRGDSAEWAIQAELNQGLSGTDFEKWHVYAQVRAVVKPGMGTQGAGLRAGVYDDNRLVFVASQAYPLEQVAGDTYRTIDLGVQSLNKYGYIWFASEQNPAVEKILVDRVILIREK